MSTIKAYPMPLLVVAIRLSASAVDAMLKIKNRKEGSLYSRIEAATKDGLITEGMKD